jgi:large subunit ribosomal protein L1
MPLGRIIIDNIKESWQRLTKNRKAVLAKYNPEKEYTLWKMQLKLLKEITFTKFDSSVDVDIRLRC